MKLKQDLYQWMLSYAGFLLQKGYISNCTCPDRETCAVIQKEAKKEY